MKLILSHDTDAECPNEWGTWKLYSFNPRHRSFRDPSELNLNGKEMTRRFRNNTAFFLDYYEHSDCQWSLTDEGPRCRWDTVRCAGVLVWEGSHVNKKRTTHDERVVWARSFLKQYTAWCNGEVYDFCLEDDDGNIIDQGCGYYDPAYMAEQVREAMTKANIAPSRVSASGDASFLAKFYEFFPGETVS